MHDYERAPEDTVSERHGLGRPDGRRSSPSVVFDGSLWSSFVVQQNVRVRVSEETRHGLQHVRQEHLIGLPSTHHLLAPRPIPVRAKLSQVMIVSLWEGSAAWRLPGAYIPLLLIPSFPPPHALTSRTSFDSIHKNWPHRSSAPPLRRASDAGC